MTREIALQNEPFGGLVQTFTDGPGRGDCLETNCSLAPKAPLFKRILGRARLTTRAPGRPDP